MKIWILPKIRSSLFQRLLPHENHRCQLSAPLPSPFYFSDCRLLPAPIFTFCSISRGINTLHKYRVFFYCSALKMTKCKKLKYPIRSYPKVGTAQILIFLFTEDWHFRRNSSRNSSDTFLLGFVGEQLVDFNALFCSRAIIQHTSTIDKLVPGQSKKKPLC